MFTLHVKSGLCACSLHVKSGPVIISMRRTDASDPYDLGVVPRFSRTMSPKLRPTNSGPCVRLLFVGNSFFACKEHAQSLLFTCKAPAHIHTFTLFAHTRTHIHIFPNFFFLSPAFPYVYPKISLKLDPHVPQFLENSREHWPRMGKQVMWDRYIRIFSQFVSMR